MSGMPGVSVLGKRLAPWLLFLACLLVLSFSVTPYSAMANTLLISLRLGIVAILSILTLRETWRHRHDPQPKNTQRRTDSGARFLKQWRRLYYGD